ncbi:uncharacterized protein MONOS_5299 [Monocercomonoides exilis]|uniref:uncharacterized protein n=1 Tax=Monocercomonoides exilis TaxID=2049356 RepID=UPI00355A8205|nr:hypothetical protein MONOS_5299 [Monocercomonoides exilis]|eukprot:MONOS_5299.1-p1 / transcript=MONOS_5299.1 / gene=MONOS_5299 / organism=Monocercomonoides_exilis_PA203 / gene_product=unspecified product / transcript_product=unspecified product / location=Mono_scaffold00152:90709-91937(+) / protein_length=372 / sequence_SO=supercontig / SO=protein_coding / is_pseudo=false
MSSCNADECTGAILEMSRIEKFSKIFSELERCKEDVQKQKILEMNKLIVDMDKEEFETIFTVHSCNKIHKIIREKKLTLVNAIVLLKHIGCCKVLKRIWIDYFEESSLNRRFKKMIIDEKKKKEKDDYFLVDLCECYLVLFDNFSSKLISIRAPCLLKVALNKEKFREIQKEAETALLALSCIAEHQFPEQELHLNEIKEIIKYHQVQHNLTQLAYQSAWQFFINRLYFNENLEEVIVNELHLAEEARKELDELSKCVDWKRKKDVRGKEKKEEIALLRWLQALVVFLSSSKLWNDEFAELIGSIVQVFRFAKDNYEEIGERCINILLKEAFESFYVKVEDFLKEGAFDVLERISQSTLNDEITISCLQFY